jgi:hypothetical protein
MLCAVTTPVFAHHPSGTGTSTTGGPIVTFPGTTLEQGASAFALIFEHISFEELSDAVLEAAAAKDEHAHSLGSVESPSLAYAYGVTDRLSVALQLPYVIRTGIREATHHHDEGGGAHEHHDEEGEDHPEEEEEAPVTVDRGNTDGFGDVTLFGQYRFYGQASGPQVSFLMGLKTPTGKTGERDDQGELFEAEFQPGSGSWDPMFGLALTRAQGRWSFDTNVLYTVATEGTQDTDLGDRFHYNGAVTYRLKGGDVRNASRAAMRHDQQGHDHNGHEHAHEGTTQSTGLVVDAVLELNGEWQAKQNIDGATDPNSGGNVVYLSPGVRIASNTWSGFVTVGLPIVNDLNGLQSEPTYRLFGGVLVGF